MTISTDYYVDLGHGDDSAAGTSPSVPWNTLDKVMTTVLQGQTVAVRCQEGTYVVPNCLPPWADQGLASDGILTFIAVDSNWDEPAIGDYSVVLDGNSTLTALMDAVSVTTPLWNLYWRNFHFTRFVSDIAKAGNPYYANQLNFYNCKVSLCPNGFSANGSAAYSSRWAAAYCVAEDVTGVGYPCYTHPITLYKCIARRCGNIGFGSSYNLAATDCIADSCVTGFLFGGASNQQCFGVFDGLIAYNCTTGFKIGTRTQVSYEIITKCIAHSCTNAFEEILNTAVFGNIKLLHIYIYNCPVVVLWANHTLYITWLNDYVVLTDDPLTDPANGDFSVKRSSPVASLQESVELNKFMYTTAGPGSVSLLPEIDDSAPSTAAEGETVTITGIFSTAGNAVSLGGISSAITSESASSIECTVPAGLTAGEMYDIVVTDANGSIATAPNGFRLQPVSATLVIRALSRRYWDSAGGETINITIENASASGNTVLVNGASVDIVSESASLIIITTPALAAGIYDMEVRSALGNSDTFTGAVISMEYGAESPIALFFEALKSKIETSTYITDADNVVVGETKDLFAHEDANFPRVEILCKVFNGSGYASQRSLDFRLRIIVVGYLKRDSDDVTISDMTNLTNFGIDLSTLIYGMLDDKQNGLTNVPGFLKFSGYPSAYYDFELIPKISTALLEVEADFQLNDTQTR